MQNGAYKVAIANKCRERDDLQATAMRSSIKEEKAEIN
jgi:hypothetical protein